MKIPYLPGKARLPQPALGGGMVRHRPIMAVGISGPSGNWILDGLLDTGSDDTIFPEWVAAVIGLDMHQAIDQEIHLAGRGKPLRCRYWSTKLRLTDGLQETYEWNATVGFVTIPLKCPLLGLLAPTPLTIIGGKDAAFERRAEIDRLAGAADKLKRK